MFRAIRRLSRRLFQPIAFLFRLLPAPFVLSVRSRRASVRLFCSSIVLLLLNGHIRQRLELDEPLCAIWAWLIDYWRGLLWFLDRAPVLIELLAFAVGLLAVIVGCWLIALYLKLSRNYLNAFTVARVALNFGMKRSAETLYSLLLSLPSAIALSIAWSGPASLIALGYALFILWMLHVSLSDKRVQNAVADFARMQGSLGGHPERILPFPVVDDADHVPVAAESAPDRE